MTTAICPRSGEPVASLGAPTPAGAYSIRPEALDALRAGDRLLGRCVGDRYIIVHVLGQGMMGTVYEAIHASLGRRCALKVLRPGLVAQPAMRERFRREAHAIASLDHPNIVQIHDHGVEPDGLTYITMEFVDSPMMEVLRPYHRVTLGLGLHILLQLLGALIEAHSQSVIHRDLKPENVAICQYPGHPCFVKVLDFGLAKIIEDEDNPLFADGGGRLELTMAGEVLGTPLYMSPEQAGGDRVDARADLYAVGAMAYEMFSGQPPFDGPTSLAIMMKHLRAPVLPLKPREGLRVSAELRDVITRCLAKDPDARPDSAEALTHLLEQTPEVAALQRKSFTVELRERQSVLSDAYSAVSDAYTVVTGTASKVSSAITGTASKVGSAVFKPVAGLFRRQSSETPTPTPPPLPREGEPEGS